MKFGSGILHLNHETKRLYIGPFSLQSSGYRTS